MKITGAKTDGARILEDFFQRLRLAGRRVLLSDYDGTLAPFRVERDLAIPYPGVSQLLSDISQCGCRVVLISGRPASEVANLLDVDPVPEIWGAHGMERISATGRLARTPLDARHSEGLDRARELLVGQDSAPVASIPPLRSMGGVRGGCDSAPASSSSSPSRFPGGIKGGQDTAPHNHLEVKYGSLALHWRGMTDAEAASLRTQVEPGWEALADEYGLKLRTFDGGLELRVPTHDKGHSVRSVLDEEPDDAVIAYLGDDLTDEDAFRALEGRGFTALVRGEWRDTAAAVWLKPPVELIGFLRTWLSVCPTPIEQ